MKILPFDQIDLTDVYAQTEHSVEEEFLLNIAGKDLRLESDDFNDLDRKSEKKIRADLQLQPDYPWNAVSDEDLMSWAHQTFITQALSHLPIDPKLKFELASLIFTFGPHLSSSDFETLQEDIARIKLTSPIAPEKKNILVTLIIARNAQALNRQVLSIGESITPEFEEDFELVIEALISGKMEVKLWKEFPKGVPGGMGAFFQPESATEKAALNFKISALLDNPNFTQIIHEMIHAAQHFSGRVDLRTDYSTSNIQIEAEAHLAAANFGLYFYGSDDLNQIVKEYYETEKKADELNLANKKTELQELLKMQNTNLQAKNLVANRINVALVKLQIVFANPASTIIPSYCAQNLVLAEKTETSPSTVQQNDLHNSLVWSFRIPVFAELHQHVMGIAKSLTENPAYKNIRTLAERDNFLEKELIADFEKQKKETKMRDNLVASQKKLFSELYDILIQAARGDIQAAITAIDKMATELV